MMANDITIELAGEKDWERVRAIRLAALQDTPDAFSSTFERESAQPPEWWQGRLAHTSAATFLAVHGQDAGMAVVTVDDGATDAWLCGVWVAPAHRGCGVGDALMSAAIRHAEGLRVHRLVLEVAETNTAAQTLYLRHGFLRTGRLSPLPPPREHMIEVEFVRKL